MCARSAAQYMRTAGRYDITGRTLRRVREARYRSTFLKHRMIPFAALALVATGHAAGYCAAAGYTPSWVSRTAVLLIPAVAAIATATPSMTPMTATALALLLPGALVTTVALTHKRLRHAAGLLCVLGWLCLGTNAVRHSEARMIILIVTAALWVITVAYPSMRHLYKAQQ